jgi:hypothetical protein
MAWAVLLSQQVVDWLDTLDDATNNLVQAALDVLSEEGPELGRPLVGHISGPAIHNLRELRPGSIGRTKVRLLFVSDPVRRAVLLITGNKAEQWHKWYEKVVRQAETRYAAHLRGEPI